jgi:hypothetical protein
MGFRPEVSRNLAMESFYDDSGVISRGIIDDDNLLVRPIDCERAFNRGSDEVAVGYNSR